MFPFSTCLSDPNPCLDLLGLIALPLYIVRYGLCSFMAFIAFLFEVVIFYFILFFYHVVSPDASDLLVCKDGVSTSLLVEVPLIFPYPNDRLQLLLARLCFNVPLMLSCAMLPWTDCCYSPLI